MDVLPELERRKEEAHRQAEAAEKQAKIAARAAARLQQQVPTVVTGSCLWLFTLAFGCILVSPSRNCRRGHGSGGSYQAAAAGACCVADSALGTGQLVRTVQQHAYRGFGAARV